MYNMILGMNPIALLVVQMLGLGRWVDKEFLCLIHRFRDAFLVKKAGEEPYFSVYTRIGGPNRPDYEEGIERLRSHPKFVKDYDDDFDATFATFEFEVAEEWEDVVEELIRLGKSMDQTPAERHHDFLTNKLPKGDREDPEVDHALDVGEELMKKIADVFENGGGGVIEV